MRIAFVGVHGIGKTKLIEDLKKEYPNLTYIENIPNILLEKIGKKIDDLTYEEKIIFQLNIFNNQEQYEILNNNFISERSIIDSIVYSKGMAIHAILKEYVKIYLKIFPYTKIYFLKDNFSNLFDEEYDYKEAIQLELFNTLNDLNLEYEELVGLHREKVNKVISYIKNNI